MKADTPGDLSSKGRRTDGRKNGHTLSVHTRTERRRRFLFIYVPFARVAMACCGANGVSRVVREGRQKCFRRQIGWGVQSSSTVIVLIVAMFMVTVSSINAGETMTEIRQSDWTNEQTRMRQQAATTDDRRSRVASDASNWASLAPPVWLWRHLDTVPRRLDAAEGRLARIEALIELRLDQMVEGERSRNAKEDLWRDQESRRIELSFDRLERRLAYMETRLTDAAAADRVAAAAATPRLQEQLRCQQEKLEESVEGVRKALVELVPSTVAAVIADKMKVPGMNLVPTPNLPANSHPASMPPCSWTEEHVQNLSKHATETLGHLKLKLMEEFGIQAEKFVSKVGNMYNDLWHRAQSIETLLRDALVLGNSTQRDLHEGFRALVQQQQEQLQKLQQHSLNNHRERHSSHSPPNRRQGGAQSHGQHNSQNRDLGKGEWSTGDALELGLGSLELSVDALSGTVTRRLGELGRRLDSSFRMLLLAQNLFLESCHRIQLGEPTLEARLSVVLEKLLDTVSNRSQSLDHEAVEIKEALHSNTNQIATMMEEFEINMMTAVREGNEWLSTEFIGENQRTKDDILSLVKSVNGFGEDTKPELCSLLHENNNETSLNGSQHGEPIKVDTWNKIPADILEPEFEFHHVSAVVKDTDTMENISVIASMKKKEQEVGINGDPINDTAGLEIHVKKHPIPESVVFNELNESSIPKGLTDPPEIQSKTPMMETLPKPKEMSTSTDPNELAFEHVTKSTTNSNVHDLTHRVERKISTENNTKNGDNMEKEGENEMKHLQAIIGALTDHVSSWDIKNISDIPEGRDNNSSVEEMKHLLKDVILQIANEKTNVRDLKFNKTLDSALDDASLSHFVKAVFMIYKAQKLDLNLENLKAKIAKESSIGEDLENLPESNTENENVLKLNAGQEFNSTEAYFAMYVKRIINLASQLDLNTSDSP